jgi:hypothetical protein
MPQVVENCILRTSFEFIQLARELLQTTPENMLGLQIMPDDNRERSGASSGLCHRSGVGRSRSMRK